MSGPDERSPFLPRGAGIAAGLASAVPFADEPIDVETRSDGAAFSWRGLPGFVVKGRVRRLDDGLGIVGLEVRAEGSTATVTTSTLRRIPLGHLEQVVRARLAHLAVEDHARRIFGATPRKRHELETAALAARPTGAPRLGPDHYRRVALALLDELTKGPARGVHERLAKRLTKDLGRPVNRDTARDWVRIARRDGWLAPTKQGRPGGEPGRRLIEEEETR